MNRVYPLKGRNKPVTHHKYHRLVRVSPLFGRIIDEHLRPFFLETIKDNQSIICDKDRDAGGLGLKGEASCLSSSPDVKSNPLFPNVQDPKQDCKQQSFYNLRPLLLHQRCSILVSCGRVVWPVDNAISLFRAVGRLDACSQATSALDATVG